MNKKLLDSINQEKIKIFGSLEEANKARPTNEIITNGRIQINPEAGIETWVCSNCKKMIVADIHGSRAKMKVGNKTTLVVKYEEMAAICECGTYNSIAVDGIYDYADEIDRFNQLIIDKKTGQPPIERDSLFIEDERKAKKFAQEKSEPFVKFIVDFLLKLK